MLLSLAVGLGLAQNLYLIPTPQSVDLRTGSFKLDRHVSIVVAKKSDDQDSFAAEGLIEESPASFGWGKPTRGQPTVVVGRIGRDSSVDSRLSRLGLRVPSDQKADSYILSVRPEGILCAGSTPAGTFYAVQTLKQLIRSSKNREIPSTDIVDWPALKIRGWQDDISRGPIPTLDFLKKQVKELSEYKLNAFTLYTEHVYKLKKHPAIAPKDGISAEEIIELDKYCKKHHVQLIGNFQSFGHFANILSVPGYEHLGETPTVITPAKEESYTFLKEVYDEIAPSYSSPYFNINCDETYGLGDGPSKEMVAKEGLGNVYAKHITRITSMLKTHGKTPMMWGDIALQYPDIRKNLPKDLIVLTWGYDPRASFMDQIEPFTKTGFRFLVCPGVSCWGQIFPDFESATVNISNFVRDGYRSGAMGVLNTTWDDTGENLFNNNWYPLVWGAEVSWNPALPVGAGPDISAELQNKERAKRLTSFNESFPRLFFGLPDGKLSATYWLLSNLRKNPVTNGMSDGPFWRAPWELDSSLAKEKGRIAQQVTDVLMGVQQARSEATRNQDTLLAAEVAAYKVAYLATLVQTKVDLVGIAKIPAEFRGEIAETVSADLNGQLGTIKSKYAQAWRAECRRWWLDRNEAKFDRAMTNTAHLATVPVFDPPGGAIGQPIKLKLEALVPGEIRYTLDGSAPSQASSKYVGPIDLTQSANVKAVSVTKTGLSPVVGSLYTMLTRPAKIETAWNHYGDHTRDKAFDGLLDTYFWSYGSVSKDATFTVVFDDPDMVAGIKVTTGHPDHPDDWLKEGTLEVSTDGERWREMGKFDKGVAECGMIGFRVKAIRIKVGRENGNWLVIREIELKK